jgi:hypothetical protein
MIIVKDEIYRYSTFDVEHGTNILVANGTKVTK